jgi:F-type H+-transporting ATPase subunit epsilon
MSKINLKVVTLEGIVYQDFVDYISLPTSSGRIGILPNHSSLVSILAPGEMFIQKGDAKIELALTTGYFEVRPGSEVVILADTADHIKDMNIGEIEKAKARVEKLLQDEEKLNDIEFAYLENALTREISRLNIAHKYHKHH